MATRPILETIHERANGLFARGELVAAIEMLSAALAEGETSELWSDWGAVQASRGEAGDAERAFRRALRMDSASWQAAENLGVLLYAQGRLDEAGEYLEQALAARAGTQPTDAPAGETRTALEGMLAQCAALRGGIRVRAVNPMQATEPTETRPSENPKIDTFVADASAVIAATTGTPPDVAYDEFSVATFGQRIPVPGVRIAASWAEDSSWGLRAYNALAQLECEYAQELLAEIAAKNIPGDIAEFGIYQGWWINFLWQATEAVGLRRHVYGFDSFEGLSEPHPQHDQSFWKKGQYACSLEQVRKNVRQAERSRLKLVKGFFEKSLRTPEALLVEQFCYARIDCDIYLPALECLRYLGPRLADGAIVVFDDWPHLRGFGEQRALEEWLPSAPSLKFEFLFYGAIGHFYTRVHHR